MRGNPFLQLVLIVVLFAAAGFPVWKLTRPAAAASEAVPTAAASPTPTPGDGAPLKIEVKFTPAAKDFRLTYLGRVLLEGRGPQAEFGTSVKMQLPPEGAEFALQASWDDPALEQKKAFVNVYFPDGHAIGFWWLLDDGGPMVEIFNVTP